MLTGAHVADGLHFVARCSLAKSEPTPMPSSDVTSPADYLSFDEAVRIRAWEWLVALQRRLNVDLHLVDEHDRPTLLPGTLQTTAVGRLLAAGSAPLQAAVAASLRTRTPHGVTLEGMQIVAVGLPVGQNARGALVLARTLVERGPTPQQVRGELELLGLWLSGAVAAHLASAPVGADGGDRLAVLARLLGDVAATGSDRDLVSRLADVLAVWHDIELFGYVDTGHGRFVRDVALPGADDAKVPATIDAAALPHTTEARRLAWAEIDALGFSTPQEVLAASVPGADGSHSWLLLMLAPAGQDLRRLTAYVMFLAQAAAQAAATSSAKLVASITEILVESDDESGAPLGVALGALRDALRARSVGIVVTAASGAPLVRVKVPADETGEAAPADEGGQLVVVRRVPDEYSMVLAVDRVEQRTITPHDRYVAGAAADLLQAKVRRIVRRGGSATERRAGGRSFGDVIARLAEQAVERGASVSVIVVSNAQAVFEPGVTQRWVARIRGSLRAADLVGMLGEGEVALLLPDTADDQAREVAARVERMALEAGAFGPRMRLGIASRRPGQDPIGNLVQQARQNVLRQGGELIQ